MLAVQERLTLCTGGGVPVPVNDWSAGEFEALLVNDMLPDARPVAEGVNVIANWTGWPTGMVIGYDDNPLRAKAEPFRASEYTITLAPVAVSVPVSFAFVPTITLPKASVPGVTVSCPSGAVVPVPLSGMDRFGFDASETIEIFPLSLPEEGGAKVTGKV